jgi:hypothetical protein
MKNSECEIRITSNSKSKWVQIYKKLGKDNWEQITNGVFRTLTAEQVLSHILPLLSIDYKGGLSVSVIPDSLQIDQTNVILSEEEMTTPKYLYRPSDYTVFMKMGNDNYDIKDHVDRSWLLTGWDYSTLISRGFLPCTENDFDWLKKKHDQYYKFLSWSTRPDGHGGSKGGTMDEYLERYGNETEL